MCPNFANDKQVMEPMISNDVEGDPGVLWRAHVARMNVGGYLAETVEREVQELDRIIDIHIFKIFGYTASVNQMNYFANSV